MSAPVRFLFVAVAGWALFRGVAGGIIPTAEAFTVARAEAAPPPAIVPTEFPALTPIQPQPAGMPAESAYASYPPGYGYYPPQPRYIPIYYPATAAASRTVTVPLPPAQQQPYEQPPEFLSPIEPLEDWDLAQVARGGFSRPAPQSSPAPAAIPNFIPQKRLDRLQLSAWALLRREPGTGSLASGGILGGSQAGARLTYAFDRRLAASLRTTRRLAARAAARWRRASASLRCRPFPSRSPPSAARPSASSAPAAPPSPCSLKAASINSPSDGTSSSMAMRKRASSGSAAGTCSPTAA